MSSVFWLLTLTVDELETRSPWSLPKCEVTFYRTQEKKGKSPFALRQGEGENWKLMPAMNSVSKLAKKTEGRRIRNGKKRGDR